MSEFREYYCISEMCLLFARKCRTCPSLTYPEQYAVVMSHELVVASHSQGSSCLPINYHRRAGQFAQTRYCRQIVQSGDTSLECYRHLVMEI